MSNPRHPIYVVSKGRAESSQTSRHLTRMGVPHRVIVEPSEVDTYRAALADTLATIVELDMSYKERYDTCDDLGLTKSTGPGPARNFAWDESIANGALWHWVMDDNIMGFFRLNRNLKTPVADGTILDVMEAFVDRYDNVAMAGPNYFMFAPRKDRIPPFVTNTRIYSCNLIRNDLPYRWRGRYNEDTILSLDMLLDGWCTIQFNAFLQNKATTQTMKGGNTDDFYAVEGTTAKSEMLAKVHPGDGSKKYVRVTERFGRVHHYVDYKVFRQKLHRRDGIVIPEGVDDFGMVLEQKRGDEWVRIDDPHRQRVVT